MTSPAIECGFVFLMPAQRVLFDALFRGNGRWQHYDVIRNQFIDAGYALEGFKSSLSTLRLALRGSDWIIEKAAKDIIRLRRAGSINPTGEGPRGE